MVNNASYTVANLTRLQFADCVLPEAKSFVVPSMNSKHMTIA